MGGTTTTMGLRDLKAGQRFTFEGGALVYAYNGNGWYGAPYSGGPWHTTENPAVVPLGDACNCGDAACAATPGHCGASR